MSGLEVAGLALAVFPLCVQGLKYYADGARMISEMRHHHQVLREFARELAMQESQFYNTCVNLLEDMVSPEEQTLLMQDPGGELWSTPDFTEKLHERMRQHSAMQFMRAIETMKEVLVELNEKFLIDTTRSSKRASKKLMKRFSLTLLKTYRDEQLVRIRNLNHDLDKLVNGSVRPATSKPSSKSDSAAASRYYKSVRDHAMSLYGVLKEKFQAPICVCDLVHDANLQLEVRRAGIESYNQPSPPLRFKFIFSFDSSCPDKPVPWNWREIEMEQISNADDDSSDNSEQSDNDTIEIESLCSTTSSLTLVNSTVSSVCISTESIKPTRRVMFGGIAKPPPPRSTLSFDLPEHQGRPKLNRSAISSPITSPSPQIIQSLCTALRIISAPQGCLGVLLSNIYNTRHSVWPSPKPQIRYQEATVISLDQLLSRRPLKRKDRLVLGVQLSSSVLQLHKTPWLEETWGRRDVWFLKDEEHGGAITSKPLVRKRFEHDRPPSCRNSKRSRVVRCNKSLFSLGIVLLELWFWKRIEDMNESNETDDCGAAMVWNETMAYMTALGLIDELYDDAGAKYGDAVRRCIQGLDCRETDLEKEDFKREVHEKIMGPLKENLEAFCAGDLPESI